MKKITAFLLAFVLLILLASCSTGSKEKLPTVSGDYASPVSAPSENNPVGKTTQSENTTAEETTVKDNITLQDNRIRITVGASSFTVTLTDNESAKALRQLLESGDRTIPASNYGGFEKVCRLGTTLPRNDVQTTTSAGDVMLYNGDQIVIFYDSNSWAYTRLGKVDGLPASELKTILSGSETEITLSIH